MVNAIHIRNMFDLWGTTDARKGPLRKPQKDDGRPQGATHHNRTAPVPTMRRSPPCPSIVGTGPVAGVRRLPVILLM